MKKILFFIGIICAGIIATWSCSSDEKSITEEPQEGTTSLEFGLDLQSLGTKGADATCKDLAELIRFITNTDKSDDIEAFVQLKDGKGNYVLNEPIELRVVTEGGQTRIVTVAKNVDVKNNGDYSLESLLIRKKKATPESPDVIYYATMLKNSPAYDANSKIVKDCVAFNGKPIAPVKFGKTYHNVCLHCLENYTPADFGLSIYDPKFFKHYCIPFVVDICEYPGGLDLQGHGEYFIYRAVISGNGSIPAPGDWELIATGTYGDMTNINSPVNDPKPGNICFYDDLRLDNSKEWYSIKLYNKRNPLTCCYIETVPFCRDNDTKYKADYKAGIIKGIPLNTMLKLATTDNPGWMENHNTVHFWWCSNLPDNCAPNLYDWPKHPSTPDYTWYDTEAEVQL